MTNSYCICKSSNDVVRLFINLSYALFLKNLVRRYMHVRLEKNWVYSIFDINPIYKYKKLSEVKSIYAAAIN